MRRPKLIEHYGYTLLDGSVQNILDWGPDDSDESETEAAQRAKVNEALLADQQVLMAEAALAAAKERRRQARRKVDPKWQDLYRLAQRMVIDELRLALSAPEPARADGGGTNQQEEKETQEESETCA